MTALEAEQLSIALGPGPIPSVTPERGEAAARAVHVQQGQWSAQFEYELLMWAEDGPALRARLAPLRAAQPRTESDTR